MKGRGPIGVGRELCLGLVVSPAPGALTALRGRLAEDRRFTIGEAQEHRLPIVTVTRVGMDRELLDELRNMPEVLGVDIAYAEYIEEGATS